LALPVLAWLCGYSYAKRFTSAAHLWLGIALALSPVGAWIALRGEILIANPLDILPAILLGVAIACWVAGFDIIYACQDADFDREAKLHSVPARFGVTGGLRIAAVLHLAMWLVLIFLPSWLPQLGLGILYYLACIAVAILLARQHLIVNAKDLSRVNEAFFTLNAIISFGFTFVAAVDACLNS
jgi:4-hydroxybenzoate polyprenyltransferase